MKIYFKTMGPQGKPEKYNLLHIFLETRQIKEMSFELNEKQRIKIQPKTLE